MNKSKKDMAVTVMEVAKLPSKEALEALEGIPGIVRVRVFG